MKYRACKLTLLLKDMFFAYAQPEQGQGADADADAAPTPTTTPPPRPPSAGDAAAAADSVALELSWQRHCLAGLVPPVSSVATQTATPSVGRVVPANTSSPSIVQEVMGQKPSLPPAGKPLPPASTTVFIACVAPLLDQQKHTRNTLAYAAQLKVADATSGNSRGPPPSRRSVVCGLAAFYAMHNKHALAAKAGEVLGKFVGKEDVLYRKLKKKYRNAPEVLLLAAAASKAAAGGGKGGARTKAVVHPKKWSKKKVQRFIAQLEGGKYAEHAAAFCVSGMRMGGMDDREMIRRCGGRAACAAFNDEHYTRSGGGEDSAAADADAAAAEEEKRIRQDAAAEAGRAIFKAFKAAVARAKQRERELMDAA